MKEFKTTLRNPGNGLYCVELGNGNNFLKLVEKYMGLGSFVPICGTQIMDVKVTFKKNSMTIEKIK
jgi:hypothetical protein